MPTIDILTVIDTQFLMKQVAKGNLDPGTPTNPTLLGSYDASDKYIFMIADGSYVVNSQSKSELTVRCQEGDTLRWTITAPSDGVVYDCIQYGFESNDDNNYITPPEVVNLPAIAYHNHPQNPQTSFSTAYIQTAWTCQVKKVSTSTNVQYDWSFEILEVATGLPVAYFKWDPFIVIEPS